MTKKKITPILVTTILSGALLSQQIHAANQKTTDSNGNLMGLIGETGGNITYHLMSEDDLLMELTPEGTKIYQSLTPEGKILARKMASRSCNNTNDCKGEGACRSDANDCAGKNKCKGQGICAFSDKNVAVKLAAKKMASKRQNAIK